MARIIGGIKAVDAVERGARVGEDKAAAAASYKEESLVTYGVVGLEDGRPTAARALGAGAFFPRKRSGVGSEDFGQAHRRRPCPGMGLFEEYTECCGHGSSAAPLLRLPDGRH
jgi:hypothetical protein